LAKKRKYLTPEKYEPMNAKEAKQREQANSIKHFFKSKDV
jgi:hypothetical protein